MSKKVFTLTMEAQRESSESSKMQNTSSSGRFTRAIPFSRPIVKSILSKVSISVSSLDMHHVSSVTQDGGAGPALKASIELGLDGSVLTGPIPVKAKVYIDEAELLWPADSKTADAGKLIAYVALEPLTLSAKKGSLKAVQATTECSMYLRSDASGAQASSTDSDQLAKLVRSILTASEDAGGVKLEIRSRKVKIKAYGMTFADLKMTKEISLQGLGGLAGVLSFDGEEGLLAKSAKVAEKELGSRTSQSNVERENPSPTPSKNKLSKLFRRSTSSSQSQPSDKTERRKSLLFSSNKRASRVDSLTTQPSPQSPGSLVHSGSDRTVLDSPTPSLPAKHKNAAGSQSSSPLNITDLEIVGGDAEKGIMIEAVLQIVNPSLSISARIGDLAFALAVPAQMSSGKGGVEGSGEVGATIGQLTLEGVTLKPGKNLVKAKGYIQVAGSQDSIDGALQLVGKILQNEPAEIVALAGAGQAPVSQIDWLAKAFEGARIHARLPPLGDKARLLKDVSLTSKTASGTSGASPIGPDAVFAVTKLSNQFAVPIKISSLHVVAIDEDLRYDEAEEPLELGKIELEEGWTGVELKKQAEMEESFPIALNSNKAVLVDVLRRAARREGIALGMDLEQVLNLIPGGSGHPPADKNEKQMSRDRSPSSPRLLQDATSGQIQDLPSLLVRSLSNLKVTAQVSARVQVGSYRLAHPLRFNQQHLKVAFSPQVATSILPDIGEPIVSRLLEEAQLSIEAIDVQKISEQGLQAKIKLRLSEYGPIKAEIVFPDGLQVLDVASRRTVALLRFEETLTLDPKDQADTVL